MSLETIGSQPRFDRERFLSLGGSDLVAYMEPLVNDPTIAADPADLRFIERGLAGYDEHHLVYAIELGTDRMPDLFATSVARHLAHPCQAVRLASHRALSRIAPRAIGDDLIDACREAVLRAPAAEVGDLPGILAGRQVRPE